MRYSPAKLPSADVAKTNAMVINDFYGCDFSSGATNIDPRRSPNCENMIRSSPGRVRKRLGFAKTAVRMDYAGIPRMIFALKEKEGEDKYENILLEITKEL